ncbi:endolytic transglycosylase MltG [Streptomyces pinistramenti]|uniref:endolytic transglycosylase MltG n=1 Tax=Streptomyces pinistramenti TaxID=2884812 RepID=UPI001D063DE0|nr:endolytic transglycosylase MltG [Streptomyces pinistramenti]MCB5908519.1 endolytic transglycosylase MltG [Streptomyces pinistramenti]
MTEYGRGYGSEPWYPEDPLYGDQGSQGRQGQQPQWDGPESVPYPEQQYHGGWGTAQVGQVPYDPYDPYAQQHDPYGISGQDPYGTPDAYPPPQPQHLRPQDPQQYPQQYPHPGQYQQQGPYAQQGQYPQHDPHDPYGQQQYPQEQQYPQDPYPQHVQEPQHPEPPQHIDGGGEDWRGEPQREPDPEHAFFADDPAGEDEDEIAEDPRESRRATRERRGKKNKRHSGCACLMVSAVLAGVVGTVGYFGYGFYQSHFASPPDFEGEGAGDIQVEIPDGAPIQQMGQILKREGVVKSVDAFTRAANENKDGSGLQAGSYALHKKMSAAAVVALMLDPKSRNGLTVREGLRAEAVYSLIDEKLDIKSGSTKEVAKKDVKSLGLPSWASQSSQVKDPLEGFLYPSTYSVGGHAKPADVLKMMIARAKQVYQKYDLEANAEKLHLKSPLEVLTVASLTQAEGITHDDFRKMAAVIYNRLSPTNVATNQKIEFDSSFNYLKKQSKINISTDEIRHYDDPYNTYFYRGLPPGPIGNPGADALKATVKPDTSQKWLFFISVDGKKTEFTTNLTDHNKLVKKFNERQQQKRQEG